MTYLAPMSETATTDTDWQRVTSVQFSIKTVCMHLLINHCLLIDGMFKTVFTPPYIDVYMFAMWFYITSSTKKWNNFFLFVLVLDKFSRAIELEIIFRPANTGDRQWQLVKSEKWDTVTELLTFLYQVPLLSFSRTTYRWERALKAAWAGKNLCRSSFFFQGVPPFHFTIHFHISGGKPTRRLWLGQSREQNCFYHWKFT